MDTTSYSRESICRTLALGRSWTPICELLTITTSGRDPARLRSDRVYLTSLRSCSNKSTFPLAVPNCPIVVRGGTYRSSQSRTNTRLSVRDTSRLKWITECADGHARHTTPKVIHTGINCSTRMRAASHSAASVTAYAPVKQTNGTTGIMYLANTV